MSSNNISFSEIPATILKPGTYSEFNTTLAARGLPANVQEVLIIGQKTSSGSIAEAVPTKIFSEADAILYSEFNTTLAARGLPANVQEVLIIGQKTSSGSIAEAVPTKIFSEADAILYSGNGSMVHRMVKAAYLANPNLSLSIVNLSDGGSGVAATGTFTITGPATSAGLLTVYIGNEVVTVAIASGDANTAVATALNAAIGYLPGLPVSGGVSSGVVTVTAKNKGTVGNQIALAYTCTATGIGVTVVAMASGATDPTLQTALTAVYAKRYHIIISPYNNLTSDLSTLATYSGSPVATLKTHVDAVSGATEMRRSRAVIAQNGSLSLTTTLAGNVNDGRIVLAYLRGTRNTPCEVAAAFGATWATMDDPSQQLDFKAVKGLHAPLVTTRFSKSEQETLLSGGVTPLE